MTVSQRRSKRKLTGGRYHFSVGKKKAHLGGEPTLTKLGDDKISVVRVLGGNIKGRLAHAKTINVSDPKTKKVTKHTITTVKDNSADRNFIRRNIITMGAIVELENGKRAKVTSRPGQVKILSGVLVE